MVRRGRRISLPQEDRLLEAIETISTALAKRRLAWGILRYWVPAAIVATALSALVYGAVQQDYRMSADDPQIQMAEDAAAAVESGRAPDSVIPAAETDISKSLAPYLIVFDDSGQPLASSARVHGQTPSPPPAVFDYVRQAGEDRITWQPESGVRSATVIARYGGQHPGFVLAGRSLREVEKRESQLLLIVGAARLATLGAALLGAVILAAITTQRPAQP